MFYQTLFCSKAIGIDGSFEMIKKAKSIDPNGEYYCSDLMDWRPKCKVDVVHSMEVFYYFKNPLDIIKHIAENWIKPKGLLIMGIDHYVGNIDSYSWPKDLNVHMTLLSSMDWVKIFAESGLSNCRSWKVNQEENKPGTLVIAGKLV
jgi:Trans-aconitate methyltransferase